MVTLYPRGLLDVSIISLRSIVAYTEVPLPRDEYRRRLATSGVVGNVGRQPHYLEAVEFSPNAPPPNVNIVRDDGGERIVRIEIFLDVTGKVVYLALVAAVQATEKVGKEFVTQVNAKTLPNPKQT